MLSNGGEIVEMQPAEREAWIQEVTNPVVAWRDAAVARGEPAVKVLDAYQSNLQGAGFTFVRDYLAE